MTDEEKLTRAVYQLLTDGHHEKFIRLKLSEFLPPDEAETVLESGKQRYRNYTAYLRQSNIDYAKTAFKCGLVLIALPLIAMAILGYPDVPRGRGMVISGFVFGVGAIIHAAYCYFTATPEGRRDI
ncbi:hypothetical protein K7W03_20545 [Sphingobium sp. PNB]|uniref:hypothetical protein n=1 Tax=Sphingobium sp. PNB TaxID=863934 RepID=UPI001CA3FA62|nr:hypothetical protein [Sphingobium sp. PNB]MCB4861985.1 hypothetical protein [Sphingobium sp. PNB]